MEVPVFVWTATDGYGWLLGRSYAAERDAVKRKLGEAPCFERGEPGVCGIWCEKDICYAYAYFNAPHFDMMGRDAQYLIIARIPKERMVKVDLEALFLSKPFTEPCRDWSPDGTIQLPQLEEGVDMEGAQRWPAFNWEGWETEEFVEHSLRLAGPWVACLPSGGTLLLRRENESHRTMMRYTAPPKPKNPLEWMMNHNQKKASVERLESNPEVKNLRGDVQKLRGEIKKLRAELETLKKYFSAACWVCPVIVFLFCILFGVLFFICSCLSSKENTQKPASQNGTTLQSKGNTQGQPPQSDNDQTSTGEGQK